MKKLILGECIEELKKLPDNSVDSVVTDPPYHLQSVVKRFGKPGSAEAKDKDGLFKRQSKGFMGKEWDGGDIAFRTEVWEECMRVLKPGGHLLAFSASRNYHRMAVAIEDAGFEVRDQLMWIYGSGFPKSHNIGKKVEEYTGWGTALKPAHEPIVMARKPLSEKTIVDNVLEWGTGGINIDESRITYQQSEMDKIDFDRPRVRESVNEDWVLKQAHDYTDPSYTEYTEYNQEGRFPANVILSEEAAENLDQHSGISKSSGSVRRKDTDTDPTSIDFKHKEGEMSNPYAGQVGGASRYFYVAKPSKKEKDLGMSGEEKQIYNDKNGKFGYGNVNGDNFGDRIQNVKRKNTHPTVKPIKLMEYLITLVTPKGGITLDPFMGSGSTGIAALQNGFQFIGIEREQEYMDIAEQRINSISQLKLDI